MEIPVNYESIRSVFKGYKKLEFDWVLFFYLMKGSSNQWIQETKHQQLTQHFSTISRIKISSKIT